jgi:hypothetical protein
VGVFLGYAGGNQWFLKERIDEATAHENAFQQFVLGRFSEHPIQRAVQDASWPLLLLSGAVFVLLGIWGGVRWLCSQADTGPLRGFGGVGCVLMTLLVVIGLGILLGVYMDPRAACCVWPWFGVGFFLLSILFVREMVLATKSLDAKLRDTLGFCAVLPLAVLMCLPAVVLILLLRLLLWLLTYPATLVDGLTGPWQGGLVVGLSFGVWGVAVGLVTCLVHKARS